jgi:hypothetical protein
LTTPLTVTFVARTTWPVGSMTSSGAAPLWTTTSASQLILRLSVTLASCTVAMFALLALPSSARLLNPVKVSSGVAGTCPLVAAVGRGATTTVTPASASTRFVRLSVFPPGLDVPPNRPYQRASWWWAALTSRCVAWTSMPWRPSIRVGAAVVPSSNTSVLESITLFARAVAPPANPPAMAWDRAVGRTLLTWASRSTVCAVMSAPRPIRTLVRPVMSLLAVASDTEMNPPPTPEAEALVMTFVLLTTRNAPPAAMFTLSASTCGVATSPVIPGIVRPGAAWPTKALLVVS